MGRSINIAHCCTYAVFLFATTALAFVSCSSDTLPAESAFLSISLGETNFAPSRTFRFDSLEKDNATMFYKFTLSNITKESVEISRIECSSPDSFTFYSSSLPGTLPPHGSADFELGFHPLSVGPHEGTLLLYISGTEEPFVFQVAGDGL